MLPSWLKGARWLVVAVAAVCGAIVHITSTLLVPHFATNNAAQKLIADLPANRMRVLPAASPSAQPLPFMSPDVRYAVCRFDIGAGPVAISALLPDKGWSLALYTPEGDSFYAVPAPDSRRVEVSFLLVSPVERPALGVLHLGRAVAEARVSEIAVPQREGLVVVRAPLRGDAYANEIEAQLGRANCGPRRS